MTFIAFLLVLGSGSVHSIWNLFAKKSMNKEVFLWYCQIIGIILFLPWFMYEINTIHFTIEAVGLLLLSIFIHGLYVVLLSKIYKFGDLSQVYPIMRGTSPIVVPLVGVYILNETISSADWISILLIVLGIIMISGIQLKAWKTTNFKVSFFAFGIGICIASYIIVDKITLHTITPVVLNMGTNIGNFIALSGTVFKSKGIINEWKKNKKYIVLSGIMAPTGYLLFLYALTLSPVALLAPMREIGIVFGTILGITILKEQHGRRRIFSAILITLGVILIGVGNEWNNN